MFHRMLVKVRWVPSRDNSCHAIKNDEQGGLTNPDAINGINKCHEKIEQWPNRLRVVSS